MKPVPISQIHAFLSKNYSLRDTVEIQPITEGEENRNFFVTTGADRYVLRVYSRSHSTTGPRKLPEIEFELDFMEVAQAHGVPTPPVIRAQNGERVTSVIIDNQTHFAVLFGYAQGKEPEGYDLQAAQAAAQTLLALRQVSLAFREPCPRPWPGDIIGLSLDFYIAHHTQVLGVHERHSDLFDRLYHSALAGYAQIKSANAPTGVIHGDVKLANLLFQSDRLSAVIDFDDYRETYLLEEFTRTVMHDLDSPTRNAIRAGFFPLFRDALSADPTVTGAEMEHLATFLRARLLYDLTAYALAGLGGLVDEVIADRNVRDVIFSGL